MNSSIRSAHKALLTSAAMALVFSFAGTATAGPIYSATSAVCDTDCPGFGTLVNTYNQAGLHTNYTSGVTDFDTYIAGNPLHDLAFANQEWFGNTGSGTAQVTYNLGSALTIDALALWNEDASGITTLDLEVSLDGVSFTSLLSGLSPVDNPIAVDYGAEVFSFGAVSTQYMRFKMSGCPQNRGDFDACAIGEVAFRGASASVTEPAPLALIGFGLLGMAMRRRKNA